MDVGSSFSAAAVTEDNLIDQLRSHGKKLVCITIRDVIGLTDALASSARMHAGVTTSWGQQHRVGTFLSACLQAFVGDDTWMQLFPTQFHDAKPFSSFNVMDLDTVDDGVWQVSLIKTPYSCSCLHSHQQSSLCKNSSKRGARI